MSQIAIEVVIDAPPGFVWDQLSDISTHQEWMTDAESITFVTDQTSGVGTSFECVTKVGPIKLVDVMEITSWEPGAEMGVRHSGAVSGVGAFHLRPSGSVTMFSWVEELRFPWFLGGPIGASVARPILRQIWIANLRRLRDRVEAAYALDRAKKRHG